MKSVNKEGIKMKSMFKRFFTGKEGTITVLLSVLFPVILWSTCYFENRMQARYIVNQAQTVMDLSTKGAAQTGKVITGAGKPFCTIPYDAGNPSQSGDHVAKKLLIENLDTLPEYAANSILQQLNNNKIEGFNDPDLRASGYVSMKMQFKYRPATPLLFNNYVFTLESTSKCQPYVDK